MLQLIFAVTLTNKVRVSTVKLNVLRLTKLPVSVVQTVMCFRRGSRQLHASFGFCVADTGIARLKFEGMDTVSTEFKMRRIQQIIFSGEGSCSRNERSDRLITSISQKGNIVSHSHLQLTDSRFCLFWCTFVVKVYVEEGGQAHEMVFLFSYWNASGNLVLNLDPEFARIVAWGPRFGPGRGLKRNSKSSLQKCINTNNTSCSLMIKSGWLRHHREHRAVFVPSISLQCEEGCKKAPEGVRTWCRCHSTFNKVS